MREPRNMEASHDLHCRREDISHAPFRLDQHGSRGVGFNLPTQSQDLHIDASVEHIVVMHPASTEQMFARENPLGCLQKGHQARELALGERHGFP
jgi:hypothetical protein